MNILEKNKIDDEVILAERDWIKNRCFHHLERVEKETLPLMVLKQTISFEELFDGFSDIVAEMVNREEETGYLAGDFLLTRHSIVYKEGKPYYVAVGHFPIKESEEFEGMVKRIFIVLSEKLNYPHCFIEVLKYRLQDCKREPYYEIWYISVENTLLTYHFMFKYLVFPDTRYTELSANSNDIVPQETEEALASECAFLAWDIETSM